MKIKKMLSGIVAGTLALSSLASMTITSNAADEALKTWTSDASTKKSAWYSKCSSDKLAFVPSEMNMDVTAVDGIRFTIKYDGDEANGTFGGSTQDPETGEWGWGQVEWDLEEALDEGWAVEVSDGVYEFTFTNLIEDWFDGFTISSQASEVSWGVSGFNRVGAAKAWEETTFELLTLELLDADGNVIYDAANPPEAEEIDPDTVNKWIDNEDGSYSFKWTNDSAQLADNTDAVLEIPVPSDVNKAKVTSVSVDFELNGVVNGIIGASNNVAPGYTWTQTEYDETGTVTLDIDGIASDALTIKVFWCNKDASIKVSNITYNVATEESSDVKYQVTTDSAKLRFVWEADEAAVAAASTGSVSVAGSETTITKAYRAIYANGAVKTASEGKVFIVSPTIDLSSAASSVNCVFTVDSLTASRTYTA